MTKWMLAVLLVAPPALALDAYQAGDRVECEVTGRPQGQYWEAGTVLEFRPGDGQDGSWYRVKADSNKVEYYCKLEVLRRSSGPAAPAGRATPPPRPAPGRAGAPAGRGVGTAPTALACPVVQPQVRNGARPDPELVKLLVRCKKGERGPDKRGEGAVAVEVTAVQVGKARPWVYNRDTGNGSEGTFVHPVKVTYNVKTIYSQATEHEDNWIRIVNVYVDAFGEWAIGSEEAVKTGDTRRVEN